MRSSMQPTNAFVLSAEGGLSLSYGDAGNWTGGQIGAGSLIGSNKGVSAQSLSWWLQRPASRAEMASLTNDTQAAIFGARYWNTVNGDSLPVGLDAQVADHGYNRNPVKAARLLQRLLGVDDDGFIGAQTVAAAVASCPTSLLLRVAMLDVEDLQSGLGVATDGVLGPVTRAAFGRLSGAQALVLAFRSARVADYRSLQNKTYERGWLNRVANCYAMAIRLALTAQPEAVA